MIRIFTVIIFLFLTSNSFSEIKNVVIIGNTRVSSNTIESLVDKKISNIDSIYINNLTKKIYDTDFFSDVKISYSQDILTIRVSENSVVNFFYISGLKDDDLDQANKIIILKENTIFSTSKLKKDIESVKDYFRSKGYYNLTIDPEVIRIENNQINLILNIDKKDSSKIKNIYFIGDKFFSSSQLSEVISSSEDGWWKLFSSSALNEQQIEYDKQLLKDFYKLKGFYDIQIESVFARVDNSKNFSLTYSINSGKKYKFGEVDIKPSGPIYKEKDVLEIKNISTKLLKNENYSSLIITKLNKQINNYLESSKYNNFEVNIQENKKKDEVIDLVIQLNEEPKALINKINISGNSLTEEKVIRDNIYLSEGDNLNASKLKKSIDNIRSKQYFSKVDSKIENSKEKKDAKDLNISVKEQATGSISAGVGYGTNGGIFQAGINEKNFLGKGINLNFTGELSTQKLTGEFTFVDPNFRNSDKQLAFSLISQKDSFTNSGYTNKTIGTKVGTGYEIYENIFFKPNVALLNDKLEVDSTNTSSLLKSRQGSNVTSSVGYNFSLDLRDSKYNPTSGSVSYFEQNIATLISDIPAVQSTIGSTFYQDLFSDKYIGSAKIKLASSVAFGNKDVKISDRLYASQNEIRGFQLKGIGPVDGGDHIGGNYLATLSLKSTFPNPIPDNFKANSYLFYDMGNVWGVDYSNLVPSNSKIRSSTGVALDFMSPVGPLSFTYAIPISKAHTDKEQKFLFNIGSTF